MGVAPVPVGFVVVVVVVVRLRTMRAIPTRAAIAISRATMVFIVP